jgi:gliding motility-associated-like protein
VQNINVRPSSSIYIPNAFTPGDNDITNNSWGVIANNISNFRLMVFNRWGEVIFSSYDQHEQWTGHKSHNRKELVKQDVYVYKVWYTDAQGNDQTIIGHVTVIR